MEMFHGIRTGGEHEAAGESIMRQLATKVVDDGVPITARAKR
jgi:hypothetical protein